MTNRPADPRSIMFAGDVDAHGLPIAMTVEVLRARAETWATSPHTPQGVAGLLARSRQMFVDGYYTYEDFMDAATRSLQAVEAALRVQLGADEKVSFARLIDRAHADGLIDAPAQETLHTGRKLRNDQIHATSQAVVPPAIAANILRVSHLLVSEVFDHSL